MIRMRKGSSVAKEKWGRRYDDLVENAANAIYRCRASGELESVNPAFVRLLGFESEADLRKMNLKEILSHSRDSERMVSELGDDGTLEGMEVVLKGCDGPMIPAILNIPRS